VGKVGKPPMTKEGRKKQRDSRGVNKRRWGIIGSDGETDDESIWKKRQKILELRSGKNYLVVKVNFFAVTGATKEKGILRCGRFKSGKERKVLQGNGAEG